MRGEISKFVFIDSSVDDGRVSLPTPPFCCVDNESMSFTLLDFAMRRNWPTINATNNTFYIYMDSDQSLYEVVIPPGDYATYDDLKEAVDTAIAATITAADSTTALKINVTSITPTFVDVSRTFVFTITMTSTASVTANDVEIRCYHVKSGAVPSGVSKQGAFSDCYEILGAEPLTSDVDKNSLKRVSTNKLYSQFPVSLSTLDALYIRTNFDMHSYESPGLDMFHKPSVQVQPSSIFARVPIRNSDSSMRQAHEIVTYEDAGGDMYQKFIQRNNLEHIQFYVTDKRNRTLAEFDKKQNEIGLMSFSMTLRWDKFVPEKPAHPIPKGFPAQTFPPSYGYGAARV